jgi:hypothetical protein
MQKQPAIKDILPGKPQPVIEQHLQLLNPMVAHTVEVKNVFPVVNIDHSHVAFEVAIRPNVKSLLRCKIETMVVGEASSKIQTIVLNSSDVTVLRFVIGVDSE